MSSSAFTPSTTTVTNNVPVNVPVVEAWQSYTPSLPSPWGSTTNVSFKYRRVGSSIQVRGRFTTGTIVDNTSVYIPLPSGLSIDTSVVSTGAPASIVGDWTRDFLSNTNNDIDLKMIVSSLSTQRIYITKHTNTFPLQTSLGGQSFGNSEGQAFNFEVPIAEWAGSGTTTLATRAVEEYASNSNAATTSNDTTSFAYGLSGSPVPSSSLTSSVLKRVRFQTPIQATDVITVEISTTSTGGWVPAVSVFPSYAVSTTEYGISIQAPAVGGTDVDLYFRKYADAYGGGREWSVSFPDRKWRVRKVSSGSQIGFPVSARNIVGDTSGSVVPTGMIGEVVNSLMTTGTQAITSEADITNASITLSSGLWRIQAEINADVVGSGGAAGGAIKLTNSSNVLIGRGQRGVYSSSGGENFVTASISEIVTVNSSTTYKIRAVRNTGTGTITIYIGDVSYGYSTFYAVRIA